jgi:hypothetical protein
MANGSWRIVERTKGCARPHPSSRSQIARSPCGQRPTFEGTQEANMRSFVIALTLSGGLTDSLEISLSTCE